MTPRSVSLLIGAGLVCLLLAVVFVWPTPYDYSDDPQYRNFRTNRFTGERQFHFDSGWRTYIEW